MNCAYNERKCTLYYSYYRDIQISLVIRLYLFPIVIFFVVNMGKQVWTCTPDLGLQKCESNDCYWLLSVKATV